MSNEEDLNNELKKTAGEKTVIEIQSLYDKLWWGMERHELIAAAAEQQLTPTAQAQIQRLLAPVGQDSIEQVAAWADRIKSGNDLGDNDTLEFRARFPVSVHQTWHYVNVPAGASGYSRTLYPEFTRNDDVVQMITVSLLVLRGQSEFMSRLNALRWITHLIGDVHQPIHVGCGYIDERDERMGLVFNPIVIIQQHLQHDQGGNRLLLPLGSNMTLHAYWDSVIPVGINSLTTFSEVRRQRIEQLLENIRQKKIHLKAPLSNNINLWAEEWASESIIKSRAAYQSLQITERSSTKFKISWEGKQAYDVRCAPIVSEQLELAAVRLATVLNEVLG